MLHGSQPSSPSPVRPSGIAISRRPRTPSTPATARAPKPPPVFSTTAAVCGLTLVKALSAHSSSASTTRPKTIVAIYGLICSSSFVAPLCRRAQQLCQLMRRAGIETAIGATRQAGDFAKGLLGDGIEALLEHEGGHAEKPEFSGRMTEIVELLFHGIADEDEGLHLCTLRLALGMGENLAELRVAAPAFDALHQRAEPLRMRYPTRGATLAEAAVIDQLHVQPADRRRLAKHVGLQPTGRVPGGLATHGRVEREDEAAPPARLGCRRELLHAAEKSVDLGACGACRRGAAAIGCWPVRAIIGHGSRASISCRLAH